jgi:hypothetical protein
MESELPDGFGVYKLEKSERRHLRTTSIIERYHREIKRRVTGPLPNAQSGEFCHPFRVFLATDSGANLPPIPFQSCHLDFSGFQF